MGQSYLKNAALLTGADVLLRLAGMGLRIYLANALGGEGMGLYQLVLAVYALFVTLATCIPDPKNGKIIFQIFQFLLNRNIFILIGKGIL